MAFSNTILPAVAPTEAGGNALSALKNIYAAQQQNAQNKILNASVPYAPYQAYADVLSKVAYANYLPYQLQAQVLSNPMLWLSMQKNPEAMQALMNNFSKAIPQTGNLPGIGQIPAPVASSNNLLGMLIDKIKGSDKSSNPMQAIPAAPAASNVNALTQSSTTPNVTTGSPLVPSLAGGTAGAAGKLTAPYTQSPFSPGTLIPDPNNPGGVISVPTSRTATTVQTQLLAAKRVEPQLERLADEWAPFMDLKGKTKLLGARVGNLFGSFLPKGTLESVGLSGDSDLPSKYAKAKSTTLTAPEALIKAYGLNATNETLERLQKAIEPLLGENKEGYKERVKNTLEEIRQEQAGLSQQSLSGGFSIPSSQKTENATQTPAIQQPQSNINESDKYQGQMRVQVLKPDGTIIVLPENGAKQLVKDHPDHKLVG